MDTDCPCHTCSHIMEFNAESFEKTVFFPFFTFTAGHSLKVLLLAPSSEHRLESLHPFIRHRLAEKYLAGHCREKDIRFSHLPPGEWDYQLSCGKKKKEELVSGDRKTLSAVLFLPPVVKAWLKLISASLFLAPGLCFCWVLIFVLLSRLFEVFTKTCCDRFLQP